MVEFSSPILGMRVRRNVIPANAIMGRPEQEIPQQDPQTVLALRRNQIALEGINRSISGVNNQIAGLNTSLQTISNQIAQSSLLEQAQRREKERQEVVLAEQRLREGKEGLLEKRMQSALSRPLQTVGAAAQKSLFNLGRFFQILLLGTLTNRILSVVSNLSEEGNLSLKNLFDKVKKDLSIVGAIFLGINGGFVLILRTLATLTARISAFAVKNLLLRPIRLVFDIAKNTLTAIAGFIKNLPIIPKPATTPVPKPGTAGKPGAPGAPGKQAPKLPAKPTAKPFFRSIGNIRSGFSATALNLLLGGNVQDSLASGIGVAAGTALAAKLGLTGFGIPAGLGLLGAIYGPSLLNQTGIQIPGGQTTLNDLGIPDLGDLFNRLTKKESTLKQDQQKANNIIINNTGSQQGQVEEVPTSGGSGTANNLIFVPPGNSDNPYILHSLIQYNIGGSGI
jgi:hypothetical protein